MKKLFIIMIACIMSFAFIANTYAYSVGFSNKKIYGGTPHIIMDSIPPSGSNLSVTMSKDTQFNNESNMRFRAFVEDTYSKSARRSALIEFLPASWYPGQTKTAPYINGGASASALDTRASIPNTNYTAYATFYGSITM